MQTETHRSTPKRLLGEVWDRNEKRCQDGIWITVGKLNWHSQCYKPTGHPGEHESLLKFEEWQPGSKAPWEKPKPTRQDAPRRPFPAPTGPNPYGAPEVASRPSWREREEARARATRRITDPHYDDPTPF